jgi:hypothetical protein
MRQFPQTAESMPDQALSWKQRAVVTTSELETRGLGALRILQLQDPVTVAWCGAGGNCSGTTNPECKSACDGALLSFAQIAGVERAVFGLTDAERTPLLFRNGSTGQVLVAASKLSNMISARYAPQEAWRRLWSFLLADLLPPKVGASLELPSWTASVRPAYPDALAPLPTNASAVAVAHSAKWLSTGSTLMTIAAENVTFACCEQQTDTQVCTLRSCNWSQICPAPHAPPRVSNISCIQEGWSSIIHNDGRQHLMPLFIRTDGNAEVAMGLAAAAVLLPRSASASAGRAWPPRAMLRAWQAEAAQLLDYLFRWSASQSFVGTNSSDPLHGIVWWNQQDAAEASGGIAKWASTDYGSNTGCVLMSATAAASLLKTSSWRSRMLYGLFAEIRTTGRLGNRPPNVHASYLSAKGWRQLFDDASAPSGASYPPHYGAQPAAYFLFAGHVTGLSALFSAPAIGYVRAMMASLADGGWKWTQSMTNELSTMLLTLAWLVRADDTPLHRSWLDQVASRLLDFQLISGGIKQFFGVGKEAGRCSHCPPASNAEYGDSEEPLMQDGDEPITDALYSLNFALIGLREAAGATGDPRYAAAESALQDYLIRSQVISEEHPELAGSWFRAFDYARWDYWAADGDHGYGPWVTDGGWTNGWIMAAMAARGAQTTLWEIMREEADEWCMDEVLAICREMLQERAAEFCDASHGRPSALFPRLLA